MLLIFKYLISSFYKNTLTSLHNTVSLPSRETMFYIHSLFPTSFPIIFIPCFIVEGICWVFDSHHSNTHSSACIISARRLLTCLIYKYLQWASRYHRKPPFHALPFHYSLLNGENRLICCLTICHPPQPADVNQG